MGKNKYKVILAMRRETFIVYVWAYSDDQARLLGARRVAKKHGVLLVVVNSYIKEHPECYVVDKILEMKG